MKTLICSFMTPQYASFAYEGLKYWSNNFKDCGYFVASKVCKNWPKDFSVSELKNQCLDAAAISNVDWMVLLPGIDCSLISLPNLQALDSSIIYTGYRSNESSLESCSLHLYSRKIFENYRYDENYRYFHDDYDFFYNKTKQVKKLSLSDFVCYHQRHDSLSQHPYISSIEEKEKQCFLRSYFNIHGKVFSY